MTDNQQIKRKIHLFSFLAIVLLIFPSISSGQNLVRNHSFESVGNLPLILNSRNVFEFENLSGYKPFQKNLKYWKGASKATPDLRIINKGTFEECERHYKDCNRPRSGDHMVGIMTYLQNTNTKVYREYIQIKLKKPLRPGVKTFCELWVQKDRQAKLSSNNIGFYFSQRKFYVDTEDFIEKIPQINNDSLLNEQDQEWVKVEGTFIPDKQYFYVTIGNFYDNKNTKIKKFKKFRGADWEPTYAHYLIDDVRIWQDEDQPDSPSYDLETIEENQPIVLKNIFFDLDKSILKNESFEELDQLFRFLQKNKKVKIAVHGHTDNQGNDDYNLGLSTARAHTVMDFLIKKGINPSRLKFKGFGEGKPIASNETEEGRSKNRRVEFLILNK